MKAEYQRWLEQEKYATATVITQVNRAKRVEEYHDSLDDHYANDHMESLIQTLRYSNEDWRQKRPNPSKIPIDGDIRKNLASYRDAVVRYRRFRNAIADVADALETADRRVDFATIAEEIDGQRIGLERDLQATLRTKISQLETGLVIEDDGAERSVDSGFIDITARDASGTAVVIELKAGTAGQRAVAQILSYMGDVAAEEESGKVRGILIASDFDAKAKAATKMVPTLILRRYSVKFLFSDGQG
jgi:hypothetical protein